MEKDGFKTNFTARHDDSDAELEASAQAVAGEVKELLDAGTAPGDIIVAGYSLGSVIAMYSASRIKNPNVKFVLLAGCPVHAPRAFNIDYGNLQGNFLSIVDKNDNKFGSCGSNLSAASGFREVTVNTGSGHKGFRLPTSRAMDAWKKPMMEWIDH